MRPSNEDRVRRAGYFLAIGLIVLWTGYCLLDLVYVALGYWSLTPGLGLLPFFTDPVVEPGFWGDYLKRLTSSWGAIVTGAGVIALLVRPPTSAVRDAPQLAIKTFPIIPEAERTEPRLLVIEEPRPPRHAPPREPDRLLEQERSGAGGPAPLEPALRQPPPREPEPRIEEVEAEAEPRVHPIRTASIVRALRGRPAAASQARYAESGEEAGEPRLLAGGTREEFGFFEVEYADGTSTIERLRRSEYGGDDTAGIGLVRRRLAERAAAERQPARPISAIKPVSYFGFPKR